MTTYKHECRPEDAPEFIQWIKERGGVAVWESVSLSDPGASYSTPALTDGQPTGKPHWKVGDRPAFVVTDPTEIAVIEYREVKRFHVAVRPGRGNPLMLKVTEGGTRRIHAALAKAGEGARYTFDYDTQDAVILAPAGVVSLAAWAKAHGG